MPAIIGQPAVPISNQVGESKLPRKQARRMHQWVYRWHPKRWHFYKDAGKSGEWLKGEGPESDIVVSSRIRLARNLADYPLGPAVSKQQRNEIEQHVSTAAAQFEGDLEGRRHARPCTRISAEDARSVVGL